MPALQPKWEKVAFALAGGDSQRNAYLAGGYSYSRASAHRLCTKPEIVARVAEIRAERAEHDAKARQVAAEEAGVDRAWIVRHLKHNALAALRGEPVRDAEGRKRIDPDTGEVIYKPNREAANKALELLGRSEGIFIDRTEVGDPGSFARLPEEELDAKIQQMAEKLGLPADVELLEWFDPAKREAAE